MADKKTLTPEEKKLAAEKHVDELVQKGLVALEEMRKLNQEQVDYIVAKASVAALDAHGILAEHAVKETGRGVKTKQQKTFLPANMLLTICVVLKLLV